MSVSYWNDLKNKGVSKACDICIVGAGISGLSAAYWLQKEDPNLKIIVIEKAQVGAGATGKNAGFITCGSVEHFNRMVSKHGEARALAIWRFAEKNMELLKNEIILKDQTKIEFEQKGAFSLAAQDSEFNELKNVAKLMDKNSIPIEVLSQTEVEKRVGAQGFVGGIKYCDDGAVNPMALLKLVQEKLTCEILENTEVFRCEEQADGKRIVLTNGHTIESTLVVYCSNGYSTSLDEYFQDKIYPTRGQIMILAAVKAFMEAPCYANFYLDYFRQLQDGSLLIGGFRQLETDTEKGFSEHTTPQIQKALHNFVINHLPQFKEAQVTHRWAGVMGFSIDGEPMIGSLPTDNQIFFSGGFTGHGIGLAFHGAKSLVDLMFGRRVPDWLSAKRF